MRGCATPNCTVAVTGICVLGRDAETCPDRVAEPPPQTDTTPSEPQPTTEFSQLADHSEIPGRGQLYPGLELGLEDARRLNARGRCHLVGIIGAPDAGKTAALVSLYLLLARGKLEAYRFGSTRSVMALEELARGSRRWEDGKIPAQLTGHTKLKDPRSAGFLHLRIRRRVDEAKFDLLLPDLPGEWTDELIDSNENERLQFLQAACALWLMVDGVVLADPDRRKDPIGRSKTLLTRLAKFAPLNVPLLIVVTRRDQSGELPAGTLDGVVSKAEELGFSDVSIAEIASFSVIPAEVPPGSGIEALLERSLVEQPFPAEAPRTPRALRDGARQILRYRGSHA